MGDESAGHSKYAPITEKDVNAAALGEYCFGAAQGVDDFRDGEISMRFQIVEGQLDQCAGILFNLKPNGDYLTVRFNGKEDNLVLWTFNKGVRKFVKRGEEEVPLAVKQWHTMKIVVKGTSLQGFLNDRLLLKYTLAELVTGKIGVWSKAEYRGLTTNRSPARGAIASTSSPASPSTALRTRRGASPSQAPKLSFA